MEAEVGMLAAHSLIVASLCQGMKQDPGKGSGCLP